MEMKRVVVVGGGISGLSAAHYVRKRCEETGMRVQIRVVEQSGRWGGKIETLRRDGFVIEKGPDSFLARKTAMLDLARDMGMTAELAPMNPNAKKNYILNRGRLKLMPPGLMLGIPTEVKPFVTTPLLSWTGKLRAGFDLVLPRRSADADESLGGFIRRRLGGEVLETITEPLLAGIYAGDTDALSLRATFPQFEEMERKHRSLILGMMANKRAQRAAAKANAGPSAQPASTAGGREAAASALPEIARRSMFLTFRHGLTSLVERLTESLAAAGVSLTLGHAVTRIERTGNGYTIELDDGERMEADGVILAAPATVAAKLLDDVPEMKAAGSIPYVSVANVALAFSEEEVRRSAGSRFDGTGFLVPRREGRFITACTWTSVKWLHAAPEGRVLLRAYVGRQGMEEAVELQDDELIGKVMKDLKEMAGLDAQPMFTEVSRLRRSMPQYPPGHMERLKAARHALRQAKPGLQLCGAGYDGVGVPDCVRQGREAAESLVKDLAISFTNSSNR